MKKINSVLARPSTGYHQRVHSGRALMFMSPSHACATLGNAFPWAGSAGTDTMAICAITCFGWPGDSNRAGPQLPPLLLLLQGERWAAEASAVVSTHGRKEGGSSGSLENSYILSLDRDQRSQVMLSTESRLQRGLFQDVWGRRWKGGSLVIPRNNSA